MDRIERWIKRKLAPAVAAGIGQWAESPAGALGKPIYHVTDGAVMLVLSELGFMYDGPSPPFECRYDEVEAIKPATLVEIMRLRGDLSKMLTMEVKWRGVPGPLKLILPLRVYTSVAMVLVRIVDELA